MPSFYELFKYAKTGIAAPVMTAYDKMRALAMAGGAKYPVATITGIPPLSFRADGRPLISWSMLGNGEQNGTPTPDNPIMPEFVGKKSINLLKTDNTTKTIFNVTTTVYLNKITLNGTASTSGGRTTRLSNIFTLKAGTYTIKASPTGIFQPVINRNSDYKAYIDTFTLTEDTDVYFGINVYDKTYTGETARVSLVSGASYPANFYPYGFYIPIISTGQTQTVFLGQVQTVRRINKLVLDGKEEWSIDGGLTGLYSCIPVVKPLESYKDQICTHFALADNYNGVYYTDKLFCFTSGNAGRLIFHYNAKRSVSAFKQWLADEYAAGHPVTVWYVLAEPTTGIINEPLCKIGTYADELHSEDAGITIPTVKGENTLTVGSDLQPSSVTITGHIKQT